MPLALFSVSDKTRVVEFARFLLDQGYQIVSTGGTYKRLKEEIGLNEESQSNLISVSDLTGFPEILDGRVKTLHPKIHGGLLADRHLLDHRTQMKEHNIQAIDILVVNLYPFHQAIENKLSLEQSVELIDIGGVALIRAGAKNFSHVMTVTDPHDYREIMADFEGYRQDPIKKQALAIKAFQHTAHYDVQIGNHLQTLLPNPATPNTPTLSGYKMRLYRSLSALKYGCNPHQDKAMIWQLVEDQKPFQILQGNPGYINLLDALNSWQLVSEARELFDLPCVASFKHTSPAGVGLGIPLPDTLQWVYDVDVDFPENSDQAESSTDTSMLATAYIRARNADPMSSFGDFVALSHRCDLETAKLIKREVSDGIIAPGYCPAALEILKKKKGGKYLILHANTDYKPSQLLEFREMYGLALSQPPNRARVDFDVFDNQENPVPLDAQRDLLLANITLKYAQSNNVALALDGQIIGLAAGQQSRVDCVKLAGKKASLWYLRQHPMIQNVMSLFKDNTKRQERVNAILRYLEGDFTPQEYESWQKLFTQTPSPITQEEKYHFLKTLTDVSMASDAFFPFRDNIDHASKYGVKYVMQPGGSTRDGDVQNACNQYEMQMVTTGVRMFTH